MADINNNTKDVISDNFQYILVGNIIDKHLFGENKEIKSGTHKFRAGAKVYLLPEFGGMGHENIPVYGLPRKSRKRIKMVIRSGVIKNVRVKKTFDPKIIEMLKDNHFYSSYGNDLTNLNSFADSINKSNSEIIE